MDIWEIVVVGFAALLTSMLSAVAGLGGGVVLLGVLAQFHAPAVAIPLQGGIQIVSNSSRAGFLRRSVDWPVVARASILVLPASLAGVAVATTVPEGVSRVVLGVFVLVLAWRPTLLRWRGGGTLPRGALVGVGGVAGFLNTTVGASGPVTSPFFKAVTAGHAAFVATAAAAQVVAHASKILAFGLDGFDYGGFWPVLVVGISGVVFGSWAGSRLLGRLGEQDLTRLFRLVLTALAVRMLLLALL